MTTLSRRWIDQWLQDNDLTMPEKAYNELRERLNQKPKDASADVAITVLYRTGPNTTLPVLGDRLKDLVLNAHVLARKFPGGTLGPLLIERPVCVPRFIGPYVHAPKSFETTEDYRKWSSGIGEWYKAIKSDREAWELLR